MIRPKMLAIESKGAALEWHSGQILDLWCFFFWIQARDPPIPLPLLGPAQDVDQAFGKDVAAYLLMDRDFPKDVSLRIELEDPMLIPLA
jgi:hypothetical protein